MDKSACLSQVLVGVVTLFLVVSAGVYFAKDVKLPAQNMFHAAATK
jgi:hypothetical protein